MGGLGRTWHNADSSSRDARSASIFPSNLTRRNKPIKPIVGGEVESRLWGYCGWHMETLFGCFKTRGFCLESTHLQDPERLSRLVALLCIALCWAVRTGQWQHQLKPIAIKSMDARPSAYFDAVLTISVNSCSISQKFTRLISLMFYSFCPVLR